MREPSEILITMREVWKSYKNAAFLKNVNIDIRRNRIVGVIGDNGSGKTTLLKMMAGLLRPDRGEVFRGCRDDFSYILSAGCFDPWMRVRDGMSFYQDYYHDFDRERAKRLLSQSGIPLEKRIDLLSEGMQKRYFMILGLSRRCSLYLIDEAFEDIDPFFKRDTKRFLLENMEEGSTVVMATHLLKDMEALFDEVLFVTGQTIIQIETESIRAVHGKSVEEYYMEDLAHGQDVC